MVVPFGEVRVHVSIVDKAKATCERIATACEFQGMSVEKADLDCMQIGEGGEGGEGGGAIVICRRSSIPLSGVSEKRILRSMTVILSESLDTDPNGIAAAARFPIGTCAFHCVETTDGSYLD